MYRNLSEIRGYLHHINLSLIVSKSLQLMTIISEGVVNLEGEYLQNY